MERRFRITVDGRQYEVTVEDLEAGPSLLYPQPDSMTVPAPARAPAPPDATRVPAAPPASAPAGTPLAAAAGPGDVICTMGGVVDRVPVVAGQSVRKGDEIVIVQAMKMNTPMVAPRAGKVARLAVKMGDPVEPGQVLATIV